MEKAKILPSGVWKRFEAPLAAVITGVAPFPPTIRKDQFVSIVPKIIARWR